MHVEACIHVQEINPLMDDARWHLSAEEVMAIMGSHTLVMTQACTTDAPQPASPTAAMSDRTCGGAGGRQRAFTWDNSFFKVRPKAKKGIHTQPRHGFIPLLLSLVVS